MPRLPLNPPLVASLLGALLAAPEARAGDRHFAFAREPAVLEAGDAKLSAWTTARVGREDYYSAIDQRLQFGLGLLPNLEASLFSNFSSVTQVTRTSLPGQPGLSAGYAHRDSSFGLTSISTEWRYKLTDPIADPLGFALSVEGGYGPDLVEVGGRALLAKQLREWLVVLNLNGAQRWEHTSSGNVSRQNFGAVLSAGYYFAPTLVGGVEVVNSTLVADGEIEASAIYAGPSFAYASAHYYLVLSAAPQVFAPQKANSDEYFELSHNERLWARLVLGFRL